MECYKKIGLLLCSMMFVMQSCVTNNLDDCPDAIRYAIAFKYTLHTEDSDRNINGEYDRFYKDVDKMFIYVFDEQTKLCVYSDTATLRSPFENDFIYPIPLSVGKYNIITWGWGRNQGNQSLNISTAIIPTVVPNVTSIDDARLQLEKSVINGQLEKIFYSEKRNVEIGAFMSRIDTLPLMNITNMVRVVISDLTTASMQDDTSISIEGDDGAYLFNSISRSSNSYPGGEGYFKSGNNAPDFWGGNRSDVTYIPFKTYRTDSILKFDPIYIVNPYEGSGRDSMLVVEISSLRLLEDNANMRLIINSEGKRRSYSLVGLLQEGISSRVQYNLDRYHRWQIVFEIRETYVTIHIYSMNWHVVKVITDIGGYYQ